MAKYIDNTKDYIKHVNRIHGGIEIASSQTVNDAADIVEHNYKNEIKKFTLRNNFTMGAIVKKYSNPRRSSGDLRKIENINAIVAVRKLKGGKEHYLLKQEEGGTKRGNIQTQGKVAFALDQARTSGKRNRVIKGALQLQKSGRIQAFTFSDGRHIGTTRDGFGDRQRWAILYRYTGLSGRGSKIADPRYGWDAKKPFFFVGLVRGLGIFQAVGRRIRMIRALNQSSVIIKQTGKFAKSVKSIDDAMMEHLMEKNAKKISGVK